MVTLDDRHVDVGGFRAHKQSLERPLASIFPHFCNWDELQSLLTSKTAQTHEHAVSALLALIGLHSIQLGKASHERYDGSADVTVDVLAYRDVPPRTVFLVGCTTGDPKASDLNSLTRAATRVGQDIGDRNLQIKLILFCAAQAPANKKEAEEIGIRLVDATDIPTIIGHLRNQEAPLVAYKYLRHPGFNLDEIFSSDER